MFIDPTSLFETAVTRPEAQARQTDLLHTYQEVIEESDRLGIGNIFLMGSLASPVLRDYRPHDDVDFFIPDREQCQSLMHGLQNKGYTPSRPLVLRGSSLFYLSHPQTGIPVEIRYATPRDSATNGSVWKYVSPAWTIPIMPRPLIMPPSALSQPQETRTWGGTPSRFVHDEYSWLIKSRSPYPKDQTDAIRLSDQGLNEQRIKRIMNEISEAGGCLMLPPHLIHRVRRFKFWNLPDEDYRMLHGLAN